jgi:hypothetical protein
MRMCRIPRYMAVTDTIDKGTGQMVHMTTGPMAQTQARRQAGWCGRWTVRGHGAAAAMTNRVAVVGEEELDKRLLARGALQAPRKLSV